MTKLKNIFLFLLLIIGFSSAHCQREIQNGVVVDHTAEQIVDKVVKQISKDTPFSFDFTYNIKQDNKKTLKGKGKFLSNKSKYCLISEQFGYWSNGTTMWSYNKEDNEVEILDSKEQEGTMFNFVKIINSSIKSYRPKLIRQEKYNKVNHYIIDLIPKKSSSISKIRIYCQTNTNRISKMEISTYGGNHYDFAFTNYGVNKKVNDSNFVFPQKNYPKAKLVDLR